MKAAVSAAALGLAGAVGVMVGSMGVALATMIKQKSPVQPPIYSCIHVKSGISKPSMTASIDGVLHVLCLGCEIGYAHLFYKTAVKDGDIHLGRAINAEEVPESFRNAFKDGS